MLVLLCFFCIGSTKQKKSVTFSQEPTLLYTAQISYKQDIEIYISDILKLSGTDVLVNAANSALQHKGGFAKVISDNGGDVIQKASYNYVNQFGQILEGNVWLTTEVGKLKCKALVHAVGPIWRGGKFNDEPLLYEVCTNIMKAAEGYNSISIPAISSGIFNFPIKECAMILTKAVIDYYHQNPESSITNAKLCLYSEDDATMFMQAPKLHESLTSRQRETSDSVKCAHEPGSRNNTAFKLAKTIREQNRSTVTAKTTLRNKQKVLTLEDFVDSREGTMYWIESLGLLNSDKSILCSNKSWLNSSIIDASQRLLSM